MNSSHRSSYSSFIGLSVYSFLFTNSTVVTDFILDSCYSKQLIDFDSTFWSEVVFAAIELAAD